MIIAAYSCIVYNPLFTEQNQKIKTTGQTGAVYKGLILTHASVEGDGNIDIHSHAHSDHEASHSRLLLDP